MTETITPDRLAKALERRGPFTTLSLDCFDTLFVARTFYEPKDLFGLLTFVTRDQRARAESHARKARTLATRGPNEVTLHEIYRVALPHADDATIGRAVAEELALEARHCYGFAPTIALMRAAKQRGMQIQVVSDTYLGHDELEALIRAAAGADVADMIDRIFCSSDYRRAKNQGLFDDVLKATGDLPENILHVGDNPTADVVAPARHGIQSLHLLQFGPEILQKLRQDTAAGQIAMPGAVTLLPHRAALAIGAPQIEDPAEALGFSVLGPVLARFADWVADEADALAAACPGKVHILFLLRDGYLPRAVFDARYPERNSKAGEISRFTATAASLVSQQARDHFIDSEINHESSELFLRQLLIRAAESAGILRKLPQYPRGHALAQKLRSYVWASKIAKRAELFGARMIAHVKGILDPVPGDTIMLVDLGYSGSVQDKVTPILSEALGVHVAGRYLLLREDWATGHDKRGMISIEQHDEGVLKTMLKSIAVFEQLCTVGHGSVINYAPDGSAIRAAAGVKGRQSEIRDRVQAGCLAFARNEAAAMQRPTDPARAQSRDHAAVAVLTRFLTLPLPQEVALLDGFQHDGNLGGDYVVPLFDQAAAATGLRERGLFYLRGAERMYLPAELSGQGMATSIAHLAFRRFDVNLLHADFCDSSIDLPLLVADGTEAFHDSVAATPTHEGYYTAAIPIGASRFTVGVNFGRLYEWVQIESVRFVPVQAYFAHGALFDHLALPAVPSCEGLTQVAPNLFHCEGRDSFLMVPPPAKADEDLLTLLVTFRPLAARETVSQPQQEVLAR